MKAKIYTAPNCVWCTKAKNLLNEKGIEYTEVTLGVDIPREDFINMLKANGQTGVPMIFIDGKYVGGFVQLNDMIGDK